MDLQVIDLLEEIGRKRAPRKEALVLAYHDLKRKIGRRPRYLEFHLPANLDSKTVKQEFGSYIGMLGYADELTEKEQDIWLKYRSWFLAVEKTGMNKSYKMVVLSYLLSKGAERWLDPITADEAAPYFHNYLSEKDYRMNIDFSDAQGKRMRTYDQKKMANLIAQMPMTKWSGSEKSGLF